MITDFETNKLYFSSRIKTEKYAPLWNELEKILSKYGYKPSFIEGTRDIWCRDYMPVQIDANKFSQFKYFPEYCVDHKHINLLTIQEEMQYKQPRQAQIRQIDLIVDGGNIVKSKNKVIMTEKVFAENKNREKKSVTAMLKKALNIDSIFFIPAQPYDYTGHADGMVRFFDESTLLLNDYSRESDSWQKKMVMALKQTGMNIVEFPYIMSDEKVDGDYTAKGCYINYAQIGNLVLFPQFGINEDGNALRRIKELYPEPQYHVEPINSNIIANGGGVLNCITWNIFEPIINNAIDELVPVYGDEKRMFVIYNGDYGVKLKDYVCVPISIKGSEVGDPWSLQKHLKFSHAIEPIVSEADIIKAKNLLSENLSNEQLSDILEALLNPGKKVIEELMEAPARLKSYDVKN